MIVSLPIHYIKHLTKYHNKLQIDLKAKLSIRSGIFLVLTLLVIFSCTNDQVKSSTQNTIHIGMKHEPKMLHPFIRPSGTAREIYQYLFTPMADYNPTTLELEPILIAAIPEPKTIVDEMGKTKIFYRLQFRDDARWSDGSPIDGYDYLFSVKAIKHPGTNAANYRNYLDHISDVDVHEDDPKIVDVYFDDYYMLAKELVSTMEIYPQHIYDPDNALNEISVSQLNSKKAESLIQKNPKLVKFAQTFNSVKYARDTIEGPGPYAFKKWIPNHLITLKKKKNYWAAGSSNPSLVAHPEKMIFHFISDEAAMITQLKEGNIDVVKGLSSNAFIALKNNPEYRDKFDFLTPQVMKSYYIGLNNAHPILADKKVRSALAHLVDVDYLIESMEGGMAHRSVGIFNSAKPYYDKRLSPIAFDIERAKEILSNAGWRDEDGDGILEKNIGGKVLPLSLDFLITGSELSKTLAINLQENAKKAGVKINIITKKYSQILNNHIRKGDFALVPQALSQDLMLDDPYSKWHSDNANYKDSNLMMYKSKTADALIDSIRTTMDDAKRIQYYLKLQEVMYDDQPVIFLYNPIERIIVNKKWKGSASPKRPGYMANTFTLNKK